MKTSKLMAHDRGAVLFTALLFVLIMSILGAIAYVMTSNDSAIAVNLEVSRKACYSADAGVHFALASIEADLKSNTLALPAADGATLSLSSYILPLDADITDIDFEYLPAGAPALTRIAENLYQFTVRGRGLRNADADIRVTFRNDAAFKYGVFGDRGVASPEYVNFYGYDSTAALMPSGDDGRNQCHIGSNGSVNISANTHVHGYIALGNNGTIDAVYRPGGDPEPQLHAEGDTVRSVGPIAADPLGIVGGVYAQKFNDCRLFSDNGIMPSDLTLETGQTVTLSGKSGGANYYFTKIELKSGADITVDTSAGPVHICLSGELDGKNGTITHAGGDPKKFAIFSDTADAVSISTAGDFYGVIYAPYAELEMYNHATIYGAVIAKAVDVKNPGNFYFDTSLKDKYLTQDVVLASWFDIRR